MSKLRFLAVRAGDITRFAVAVAVTILTLVGCARTTPLIQAAGDGDIPTAQRLLQQGADINEKNSDGQTALFVAVHAGQTDMVRTLLDRGAPVDPRAEQGITPLMEAVALGHLEIVKLLLKRGANISARMDTGATALIIAAGAGQKDAVLLLLNRGADVNEHAYNGTTALIQASSLGHRDVVRVLLDRGANISARTHGAGETALHWAAGEGHADVVRLLLAKGANPLETNGSGQTVVTVAEIRQHPEIAQLLEQTGGTSSSGKQKAASTKAKSGDAGAQPLEGKVRPGRLQGLYYYERNTLEKHETNSYLFSSNGRVFNGIPTGGVKSFTEVDLNLPCQKYPQQCGSYEITGQQVVFKWGGGRAAERVPLETLAMERPNDLLRIGDEKYYLVRGLKGAVLNGTYLWPNKMNTGTIIYGSQSAEITGDLNNATVIGSEHYVVFTPTGEFQEIHSGANSTYSAHSGADGLFDTYSKQDRGRYRISGHTLVLSYQSGQQKSFTFFITPQFSENPDVTEQFYLDGDDLALKR